MTDWLCHQFRAAKNSWPQLSRMSDAITLQTPSPTELPVLEAASLPRIPLRSDSTPNAAGVISLRRDALGPRCSQWKREHQMPSVEVQKNHTCSALMDRLDRLADLTTNPLEHVPWAPLTRRRSRKRPGRIQGGLSRDSQLFLERARTPCHPFAVRPTRGRLSRPTGHGVSRSPW